MTRLSLAFVLVSACATARAPCPPVSEVQPRTSSIDGAAMIEHTFAALRESEPPIDLTAFVLARGDVTDDRVEDAIVAIDQADTRRTLLVWSGGAQLIDAEHDVLAAIIGHRGVRLRVGRAFGRECEAEVYEEHWTWDDTALVRASAPPSLLAPAGCDADERPE